jgi:hypothetical protein
MFGSAAIRGLVRTHASLTCLCDEFGKAKVYFFEAGQGPATPAEAGSWYGTTRLFFIFLFFMQMNCMK